MDPRVKPEDDGGNWSKMPTSCGAGTALFAAAKAHAREAGLEAINATIRADNAGGLAYYAKMGFIDYKVEKAVPLKDGQPVDRISKRYLLAV
ncbi:ribosomal protein S18 acetylase RimI-like enzyme [Ensifer mexicanus]|nr:GNAT family N-acetyltransferase [Sinorhizobium mexicanum]MBP1887174.1 ribosomal protein S18 acetylase RimI-like enzyme [Sinorhizobium mexicanum]